MVINKKWLVAGIIFLVGACALFYTHPYNEVMYSICYVYVLYGIALIVFYLTRDLYVPLVTMARMAIALGSFVMGILVFIVSSGIAFLENLSTLMHSGYTDIDLPFGINLSLVEVFLLWLPILLEGILTENNKEKSKKESDYINTGIKNVGGEH